MWINLLSHSCRRCVSAPLHERRTIPYANVSGGRNGTLSGVIWGGSAEERRYFHRRREKRVTAIAQSSFEPLPAGGDLYLLKSVLSD